MSMTNGEIIGIGVGIVGLGVAGYALLRRPQGPQQAQSGYLPPPVRYGAPPPAGPVGDIGAVVGDVVSTIGGIVNLFEGLFGGM